MQLIFELVPVVDTTRIAVSMKIKADGIVVDGIRLWVVRIIRVGVGL